MGGSRVLRLYASLVLFLVFVNLCLTKKEKRKKIELLPFVKVFFPCKSNVFLIFAKVFYAKFVPKFTIRESCCQKFHDFLISQKFLLAKVSAPKVSSSVYPDRQFDGISFSNLHELRQNNPFRVINDHINVNSIRNKFESPNKMIKDNINILLVSETKLHDIASRSALH